MLRIRTRKFIGVIALLLLIVCWALLAMVLAQVILPSANDLTANLYYAIAGLGWVLLAMPVISWMSRPDRLR